MTVKRAIQKFEKAMADARKTLAEDIRRATK